MSESKPAPNFEAIIRPYRSLAPIGFAVLLCVLIAANVAAATIMLWLGGWPVLGFLGLDMLGIYVAFRLSYRQTQAFERIVINGEALVVERVDTRGRRREWTFPSYWVSVLFDEGEDERGAVTLRSHGRSLEVGSYLAPFERRPFADALRKALREAKASSARP